MHGHVVQSLALAPSKSYVQAELTGMVSLPCNLTLAPTRLGALLSLSFHVSGLDTYTVWVHLFIFRLEEEKRLS